MIELDWIRSDQIGSDRKVYYEQLNVTATTTDNISNNSSNNSIASHQTCPNTLPLIESPIEKSTNANDDLSDDDDDDDDDDVCRSLLPSTRPAVYITTATGHLTDRSTQCYY